MIGSDGPAPGRPETGGRTNSPRREEGLPVLGKLCPLEKTAWIEFSMHPILTCDFFGSFVGGIGWTSDPIPWSGPLNEEHVEADYCRRQIMRFILF